MTRSQFLIHEDILGIFRKYKKANWAEELTVYIDTHFVNRKVDDIPGTANRTIFLNPFTPELIIRTVCDYYNVTLEQLQVKRRFSDIREPRQVCMYLLATRTKLAFKRIAEVLGRFDHTTVIHSRDRCQDLIEVGDDVKYRIETIILILERETIDLKEKKSKQLNAQFKTAS